MWRWIDVPPADTRRVWTGIVHALLLAGIGWFGVLILALAAAYAL